MGTKHKYYDVIVAWANGEKIQFNPPNEGWKDFTFSNEAYGYVPSFNDSLLQWRIKPKTATKRYRMAFVRTTSVYCKIVAVDITDSCLDFPAEREVAGFIRWVGETAEVEVEV